MDVQFSTARLIPSLLPQYAAQDLEGQAIGNVMPFTWSAQSGGVFLGYDFIGVVPGKDYGYDDFEGFVVGNIKTYPGINVTSSDSPVDQPLGVAVIK